MAGCGKHIHGGRYCGDVGGSFRCADCRAKAKAVAKPIGDLIAASSLGTPGAVAVRKMGRRSLDADLQEFERNAVVAEALAKWRALKPIDREWIRQRLLSSSNTSWRNLSADDRHIVEVAFDLLNALAREGAT